MKSAIMKSAITTNQCLLLILSIVVVLFMVWWNKKNTIIEGNFVDDVTTALLAGVNTYTGDDSVLNAVPQWTDILPTAENTVATVTVSKPPDVSYISGDNCNTQSLLRSDYESDICTDYKGNYQTINQKCNALSNKNCGFVSCCVLLNGNKCVAGNANGPTYLTDQGNLIDYNYYKYRGKVYPEGYDFAPTNSYLSNCGKYASNSTNVSKACMMQMFSDAGCSNPSPKALINSDAVYEYSGSSKQSIQKDLISAVKLLKGKMVAGDADSRILCNGADPNNPCDLYNNMNVGISQACMIRMFNDAGCPNKAASNTINNDFALRKSTLNKQNLKTSIAAFTRPIKNLADNSPSGSDAQMKNKLICYGNS